MRLNLGPVTIHFGSNGKYVKREECHEAHEKLEGYLEKQFAGINKRIDDQFAGSNKRVDDFILSVNNYISLLKK